MKPLQPAARGQGNFVPVNGAYLVENLDALRSVRATVLRAVRRPDGTLSAEALEWNVIASWGANAPTSASFLVPRRWKADAFRASDSLDADLEPWVSQTAAERLQAVQELRSILAHPETKNADPGKKAHLIMDTVGKLFLANKASLRGRPTDVGPYERGIAKETESIVATAVELAEDPELISALFASFRELSNGQTVNHIVRVFGAFTGFVSYYNTQHRNRMVAVLRQSFDRVYREQYRTLLPHLAEHLLVSDQLLQLAPIPPTSVRELALGAFLHDLGKLANIDYFESDAGYDPVQIRQHVYLSVGLILMNYGVDHEGARLLAGDHHNYLGHPDGYGVTRTERERSQRGLQPVTKVLSSEPDGFLSGQALGWLPTEMLAVCDVYDAMTDPSRIYKKPMTPDLAAAFLADTMVGQGKMDPVLVDLFIDYIRTRGLEIDPARGWSGRVRHESS